MAKYNNSELLQEVHMLMVPEQVKQLVSQKSQLFVPELAMAIPVGQLDKH